MGSVKKPYTTVVLAMSADGKIADVSKSPARFASAKDRSHLEKQIALADGVLFGAGTLRAYGTTLPVSNPQLLETRKQLGKSPQPIQIVCSASGKIDPEIRFFSQPIERWLLTTDKGAKIWQQTPDKKFDRILIAETTEEKIDWSKAFDRLNELGLHKLAVLGGGELIASLLAVDLINELWLTLCPLILGSRNAPTPVDGVGLLSAKKLKLLDLEKIDEEVFLHYRVLSN
jgi:5-amino-6-(5-phosphoribosylamino)uracil reductase